MELSTDGFAGVYCSGSLQKRNAWIWNPME